MKQFFYQVAYVFDAIFNQFGFIGVADFLNSTFGVLLSKHSMVLGLAFGLTAQSLTGLEPHLFVTVMGIFALDVIVGIIASKFFKKEKIDKDKLGRGIVKLVAYPLLLSAIHQLTTFDVGVVEMFGFTVNPFSVAHAGLTLMVVWQVLISLLENFSAMGFKELEVFTSFFKMKFNSFLKKNKIEPPKDGEKK